MTVDQLPQPNPQERSPELPTDFRKHRGKYLYWLLAVGGLGLIALLARPILMTSSNPQIENTAEALPIETIEVQPVDSYRVSRTYTGQIAAIRTSNLGFSRGGEIEEVLVEEGDRVIQGQALAKLDIRNL